MEADLNSSSVRGITYELCANSSMLYRPENACLEFQARRSSDFSIARQDIMRNPGAWAFMTIFSLTTLLGVVGNALTIFIYVAKVKRTVTTAFVIALAAIDLATCIFVVPQRFAALLLVDTTSDFVCKGGEFLFFLTIPMSCFILLAIAIERFVVICLSKANFLTPTLVCVALAVILVISTAAATPSVFMVSVYRYIRIEDCNGAAVLVPCNLGICKPIYDHISQNAGWAYWVLMATIFLFMAATILAIYATIFARVMKARSTLARWKPCTASGTRRKATSVDAGVENTAEGTAKTEAVELSDGTNGNSRCTSPTAPVGGTVTEAKTLLRDEADASSTAPLSFWWSKMSASINSRSASLRSKSKKKGRAHLSTAAALCAVTGAFFIAYMPVMIMTLTGICEENNFTGKSECEWYTFWGVVWHFFLLNHAANPVIYAFMNPRFKQALLSMFTQVGRKR